MKRYIRWVLLFALVMVFGLALLFFYGGRPEAARAGGQDIALRAPAFVDSALAASDPSVNAIASVLDDEAGIAAYFQTDPLSLSEVQGLFHTITDKTADYILGTMAVPDNLERYDVNVYIHKSGWILFYYLRDDPAVMIFDWQTYDGSMNPTRFQIVANNIMAVLTRAEPTLTYYDFRYPDATNLLLAVEDVQTLNSDEGFTILDTSFQYYERSWFLGGQMPSDYSWAGYSLDGNTIDQVDCTECWYQNWGTFTAIELPSNLSHTVMVNTWDSFSGSILMMGALAIVYGP